MGQTSNDGIELSTSRIDNIELMLKSQNKACNGIEANIMHCIYQTYSICDDYN